MWNLEYLNFYLLKKEFNIFNEEVLSQEKL